MSCATTTKMPNLVGMCKERIKLVRNAINLALNTDLIAVMAFNNVMMNEIDQIDTAFNKAGLAHLQSRIVIAGQKHVRKLVYVKLRLT